jgi:predicted DNA-binding protein (MmcQ/YjbR family)
MPSAGERNFLLPFCFRLDKKEGVWRDATRRFSVLSPPEKKEARMDFATLRTYLLSKPGASEDFPFDPVTLVAKVGGKMFALVGIDETPLRVNLKCLPEQAEVLRELYPAVLPGYHMNKRHWNTVVLDGSLPDEDVRGMIDDSYELVLQGLPRARRPPSPGQAP